MNNLRAKGTLGLTLNCKIVGFGQQNILLRLSGFSSCGYSSSSLCCTDTYKVAKVCGKTSKVTGMGRLSWGNIETSVRAELHRPMGSRVDGTSTAASDLCTMALTSQTEVAHKPLFSNVMSINSV